MPQSYIAIYRNIYGVDGFFTGHWLLLQYLDVCGFSVGSCWNIGWVLWSILIVAGMSCDGWVLGIWCRFSGECQFSLDCLRMNGFLMEYRVGYVENVGYC